MPLCPKVPRSPLTYRARAGAPRTIANARRSGAGACPGMVSRSPGGAHHRLLYQQRRSRHTPRPRRGRGAGGRGAHRRSPTSGPRGRAHRRAARGGAAPANEASRRTTGGGPSGGSPTRRAAPIGAPRTQQKPQFCLVRAGGTPELLTKLCFCWVRPGVAAAELWRRSTGVSSGRRWVAKRGGTTTPPHG